MKIIKITNNASAAPNYNFYPYAYNKQDYNYSDWNSAEWAIGNDLYDKWTTCWPLIRISYL